MKMESNIVYTCKIHGELTVKQTKWSSGYDDHGGGGYECNECVKEYNRRYTDKKNKRGRSASLINQVELHIQRYGKAALDLLLAPYQAKIVIQETQSTDKPWLTGKPEESGSYLVTIINNTTNVSLVCQAYYNNGKARFGDYPKWHFIGDELNWTVMAYQELPKPYDPEV